jgi:hypothetical protein
LVTLLLGAAIAFAGRREDLQLATGLALGMGGVLLALRGERRLEGRSWLRAALTIAAFAVAGCYAIGFYEEWVAGQWFAEGAGAGPTRAELKKLHDASSLMRIVGLASALGLLLGAIVNRVRK